MWNPLTSFKLADIITTDLKIVLYSIEDMQCCVQYGTAVPVVGIPVVVFSMDLFPAPLDQAV